MSFILITTLVTALIISGMGPAWARKYILYAACSIAAVLIAAWVIAVVA